MQSQLSHYLMLAKRWAWMIVLGIVICGGGTYIISKLIHPVYQASAVIVLNLGSINSTAFDNTNASLAALPTYAQLATNPNVLESVVAQHKGMTLNELTAMVSVKPQTNTQIIELDVQNSDPQQAMRLANEVSLSFEHYANTQFPASVQILPAQLPLTPVSPKPSLDAGIGALAGLALAIALIVIFEWIDDHAGNAEEVQDILGVDALTIIPRFSGKQRIRNAEELPLLAEESRILCASLNAAQMNKPFKLVMITSALAAEGRSTIAANLATFLAKSGKRVLLVDADLRRPSLHQHFKLENDKGLSSVFQETWEQIEVALDGQPTEIPNLRVLTSGELISNPPEALQSPSAHQLFDHFKKTSRFDYVIFDTPPLLPIADAQILASYVQATVLVVNASKTPRKVLLRAKQALSRTRTMLLGVVINKSSWPDNGSINEYLKDVWQRQPKTDTVVDEFSAHTSSENGNGLANLDLNDEATKDITVTVARLQKGGAKQE